jgi:uncharacterized protein YpbB
LSEIRRVPGFGERKTELYGLGILDALARFRDGARASGATAKTTVPTAETLRLLGEGKTLAEIAQIRGRQLSSVASLVAGMVERGEVAFEPRWIHADHQQKIEEGCRRLGLDRTKLLKNALPQAVSYEEIRLVVAHLKSRRRGTHPSKSRRRG